jgi:predicted glycosyltransferase
MRFELMRLLEAAATSARRPAIVSSVRDILVAQDKPGRNDEMVALVERWFDKVLVHGDPAFIPFERTFPHAGRIAAKLQYTGYVVDGSGRRGAPGDDGWDEVLVSAGGGGVGHDLLREAIRARPLTPLADRTWRVLVGLKAPEAEFDELRAMAAPGVIVERARGDFTSLLMNCALSIGQAGYNTLMEAMRAGCRIVAAPYAGGLETEQTLRARLLEERGVLQLVPEAEVSAESIAAAVRRALERPPARAQGLRTDGAARSAALVRTWADEVAW